MTWGMRQLWSEWRGVICRAMNVVTATVGPGGGSVPLGVEAMPTLYEERIRSRS